MIDPITLTVIYNRFRQIAEEMDIVFDRGAFSPIISGGRDRACGLFTADKGLVIAQGSTGMPIHIGSMQFGVGSVVKKQKNPKPGDIYMLNDPYMGGTHLMDMKLIMPIFVGKDLFCYLGSCGHWPDVGGAVPGGFVTTATEVQQEGLRICGIRLYREGKIDQDLIDLILDNVRVPQQRMGDLQAQVASLKAGEESLQRMIAEYGAATLHEAIQTLQDQSSRLMREKLAQLKPGTYSFEDANDNDGVENEPLWIRLDLTVKRDRLVFDFSRSSKPCRGPLNCVFATTAAAVFISVKHMFPEVPLNAGCFEPIEIIAPETTFLNAKYPKPVSGCAAEVSQRVVDVCFGALAQFLPDRVTGAPVGTSLNVAIGGFDPEEQRPYILYFYTGGGHGGYAGGDGIHTACTSVGLAKTPQLEIVEQHSPVLFEEYALREDSCGPGEYRGGLGVRYRMRLLRGEGYFSMLGDRTRQGPFGVAGGGHGAPTRVELKLGNTVHVPEMGAKEDNLPFKPGDSVQIQSPGGGGYGAPAKRSKERTAFDLRMGYISKDFARRNYGDRG
ncbi:MAG: hydantoinase B/oxoprolinase family protein [Alphaproteobacteria bacterium]